MNLRRLLSWLPLGLAFSAAALLADPARSGWRIMPVGDSITAGGDTFACYRPLLAEKLRAAGVRFEFVGSRGNDPLRHEGYGGKNVEFLAETVPASFARSSADIVLLHAGHNHFIEEKPVAGMIEATERLIASFRTANPKVIVLLAQVIPAGKLPKYSYIPELNEQLSRLAARLHTRAQPVILVDQATDFDWHTDTVADLVHPNAAGAEKMAERWFAGLTKLPGLVPAATTAPTSYVNPVLPGFFPDPSIVRVGEDYYLVNSTFQYFPAIIISHSRDLVHWEQIGHVFTKREDLDLTSFFDGCGIWAPDISYHDGQFFVFYCLVQLTKDRKTNVRGNYVVKSKSILGPWSKPVQLTAEGNDPSHFVDDDGTHYMLYAGGIPKGSATKIVKLNADCTQVVEGPFWIDYGGEKRAPEGPHLLKRGGYYYHYMAASGGVFDGHHQVIARAKSILGPYEFSPHNPFIAQMNRSAMFQHQGHAKLVQTQHGEWWAVYLMQRRIRGFSQLGRETGLDRVDWKEDGWPLLNDGRGPSGSAPVPNLPFTPLRVARSDEFSATTLGPQWEFVRNPDPTRFSLVERPGWLRLRGSEADVDSLQARNVILQREVSLDYVATTKLEFTPRVGERAGLLCYYDTKSFITVGLSLGSELRLTLEECRKGVKRSLTEISGIKAEALYLRVVVHELSRTFSFSYDQVDWHEIGVVPDASFLSDQGTPQWGFMGTMVGVFAVAGGVESPTPADFDWFHHEPIQSQPPLP